MRIAIVNDVVMAVEAMRRALINAPEHQVAWIAYDGAEAVERCARDRPDLVLMDLIMPKMDGVEATRQIMARTPCAIVVVTASVTENSSKVFEAMGAGALDAVNTPLLETSSTAEGGSELIRKVETISKIIGESPRRKSSLPPRVQFHAPLEREHLVAIGASAGGPAALAEIFSHLPPDFSASIVVVQHVDTQFATSLANWLDYHSELPVRLAKEGDHPKSGTVLLAGMDKHLVFLSPSRLGYVHEPHDCSYRPSIDVLFRSIVRHWQGDVIGVLLTGMGRDGAEGLQLLNNAGHRTIAQDQTTSAVYGMPKAAQEMKAASEILPLEHIGPRLAKMLPPKHKLASRT